MKSQTQSHLSLENSWKLGEILKDSKKHYSLYFCKVRKEESVNKDIPCVILVPEKILEQLIKPAMFSCFPISHVHTCSMNNNCSKEI